jgi:predicted O-methyltransferase YrrM
MRSSYKENSFDVIFTSIVRCHDPRLVVECGILDGYSLIALAAGGGPGCRVMGYDLFEDYKFTQASKNEIEFQAWKQGVSDKISLAKEDAFLAAKYHRDNTIDILHIDISNDGDNLAKMFDVWTPKIKKEGLILFEGGSQERDEVEWMTKYKKTPINKFKQTLNERGFEYVTFLPFPSLTICIKK